MRKFLSVVAVAALVLPIPDASLLAQSSDPNVVFDAALYKGMKYRNIGPSRGGRVTTVTGVASQPGTFYMGSVGGGVWKTTDYGHNWVNISGQYFDSSWRSVPVSHSPFRTSTRCPHAQVSVSCGRSRPCFADP